MTGNNSIGTHDGTFHCDEVLACYMLRLLSEYKDSKIVRTRDQVKLDACSIVVDVGGVFDAKIHRYDHHQRSFNESVSSLLPGKKWTTKLSSAGLVYVHFGHRIISTILGIGEDAAMTSVIFEKVYENFIEEMDAIDNGINHCNGEPNYLMTTNLSSRVANLNPHWNDNNPDIEASFEKALKLVGSEFLDRVNYYSHVWYPAKELVERSLKARFDADASGQIIVFENGGFPWKEHLYAAEAAMNVDPTIKFVIYPDQSGKWRVQTVPVKAGSFDNRLGLLTAWRGLRDEELSKKSGIQGCVFVHAGGFIGGNVSYEGALQMARSTLKESAGIDTN